MGGKRIAATFGNFDGVHLGHLHLLNTLKVEAERRSLKPLVFTFEPHTREVLGKPLPCRLTSLKEKRTLIEEKLGLPLEVLNFDEKLSQMGAEGFLKLLAEDYGVELFAVGYDWHFGRGAEGDVRTLRDFCRNNRCEVVEVQPYTVGGKVVSSSLIRGLLREAKLKEASLYLGRPYWVERPIVKGRGVGRSIGFPTLNFAEVEELCLPDGVYAVLLEGLPAVANLGRAPTLKGEGRFLEVHVLDTEYYTDRKTLRITFVEFVREELTFKTVKDLVRQIEEDIAKVKQIFAIS